MKIEVITPADRTPAFQAELDALLSSKDVKKALPWTKDEATRTWLFVRCPVSGQIGGFAAIREIPKGHELASLYVDPSCRLKGVARALIEKRLELTSGDKLVRVVCNPQSLETYLARGFKAVAKRGKQFTVVEHRSA